MLLIAILLAACGARPGLRVESTPLPDQDVTRTKLDRELATADLVFAGRVVTYDPSPPAAEPHGDHFTPVTYDVQHVFKGREHVNGDRVLVYELARWPSPLVDDDLRLRARVFGEGRLLVVFARKHGPHLRSRDEVLGVVAATDDVLDYLARGR